MRIHSIEVEKNVNIEEINLDENNLILLSISPEKCRLLTRPANLYENLVPTSLIIEGMKSFIEKFKERMKEENNEINKH
jgi:hypothetical protein